MKLPLLIIGLLVCYSRLSGTEQSEPKVPDFKPISAEAIAARENKEKKARDEALARLPKFDRERFLQILTVMLHVKYPISIDDLRKELGGPNSLVWCCSTDSGSNQTGYMKSTSTYIIAADAPEYVLVVDFEDCRFNQNPKMVARARLCYQSPYGWRFEAESPDDLIQVGAPETKPNQRQGATKP